ncbi:MAG: nucleotide sugar dehydrogenase [Alphaproteobacteria bacterium]|nr:nucleotide sugar dehydrogenase [Alphaproteobacteria bacterium]
MTVSIIGLGYVGMSLSVLLAQKYRVHAVDVDQEKVDLVSAGKSPIHDPDISSFLANESLDLTATLDFDAAVTSSDFVVIATPTDYDVATNRFDTSSVRAVAQRARDVNPAATIIVKSTIPIGFIAELRRELNFQDIFFSPEFLREGRALHDNLYPSRIIVGGDTDRCRDFANMLASCARTADCPVILMGAKEAEAVKLFANTYLAMRVGYFNELDSFCMMHGLSAGDVINGVCLEPRIGQGYNNPSFGYGGYCFPKDTKQMVANFDNIPQALISAVVATNTARWDFLAGQILSSSPRVVGVYRLNMKSGSDNFRYSAVFGIVKRLIDQGVTVRFYEPTTREAEIEGMGRFDKLSSLKQESDVILANRLTDELADVKDKVFSRDLFNVD